MHDQHDFGVSDDERMRVLLDDVRYQLKRLNENLEQLEARDHEVRR